MLCAMCLSIFRRPVDSTSIEGQHHRTLSDLKAAAHNGCYVCSELTLEYEAGDGVTATNAAVPQHPVNFLSFTLEWRSQRVSVLWFRSEQSHFLQRRLSDHLQCKSREADQLRRLSKGNRGRSFHRSLACQRRRVLVRNSANSRVHWRSRGCKDSLGMAFELPGAAFKLRV